MGHYYHQSPAHILRFTYSQEIEHVQSAEDMDLAVHFLNGEVELVKVRVGSACPCCPATQGEAGAHTQVSSSLTAQELVEELAGVLKVTADEPSCNRGTVLMTPSTDPDSWRTATAGHCSASTMITKTKSEVGDSVCSCCVCVAVTRDDSC